MSNALLSDVEARAQRRRTRIHADLWQDLVRRSWTAAQAAEDPAEARRWLERAHRMLPRDGMIATALAGSLLAAGEWADAAALFQRVAREHGIAEGWTGLATCAHLLGQAEQARSALQAALRCRAPDPALIALADAAAPAGWCGMSTDGVLHAGSALSGAHPAVRMDGVALALRWTGGAARLPADWRKAAALEVIFANGPALGSPLPVPAFAGVEGFVEAVAGGLRGWAWFPSDPSRAVPLQLRGSRDTAAILAADPAEEVQTERPLARPRAFAVSANTVAALGHPVTVTGPDGRDLLGSPLDPGLEARAAAGGGGFAPVWADVVGGPPAVVARRRAVDVVVPVYRGTAETLACLDSVLASLPKGARVIVVDDASPEPALVSAVAALARRRRVTLLRQDRNRGFPAAANAGLRAAPGRDVVLLNSDTLVPPGWLERLREAAYSAPDIGTVTPLTNDGTIVSYPDPDGGNPVPDLVDTVRLDALAQQANGGETVDLPVGVGFCLYLRRDCMDQVGLLREDLFAQGYGEENDLCLRARHHGWRNVAATGIFVGHCGATSFGGARAHLVRRNAAILARLHPGYDALIERHVLADPLRPARQRMDALRWAARRTRMGAVVMVTHGGGGGVDRVIDQRAESVRADGRRAILLRPWRHGDATGVRVSEAGGPATPNLVFALPEDQGALVRLLRADRPDRVELHHTLGHHATVAGLARPLRVKLVSVVHDYARFCPRIALISTNRRYCGEPDVAGCEACVADLGSLLEDDPPVRLLLARSAAELGSAESVVAPSRDAAARIARHFPGIVPRVEPWGDDAALPPMGAVPGLVRRVAVVGAIGVEKGYEVLLGCVRDARARGLALEFVVVGYTADDERLLDAGPVQVTGMFREAEAVALIRAQGAQVAFIPSVWPETWCFTLTRAWEAGLGAAVFDLGAQAERVRRTGRGWVLPLGLSAARINDALLRLAPGEPPGHSPPTFS